MMISVKTPLFILFFNLWSFASLLLQVGSFYSLINTWLAMSCVTSCAHFFPISIFFPLVLWNSQSTVVKSRDSCWQHGLPIMKLSLRYCKIAMYPLNRKSYRNLLCSFLNHGFQGPCDICCACRGSTKQLFSLTLGTLKMVPAVSLKADRKLLCRNTAVISLLSCTITND